MKFRLHIEKINRRHIAVFGVLCLFIFALQGQIRPKQLRKKILQSQAQPKAPVKKKVKKTGSGFAKPFSPFKPLTPIISPLDQRGVTLIHMENAETTSFDKMLSPDFQVLKGNVRFRHDNAVLYCDSAYFYGKANSLDAFGHVRFIQADTIFVYSDKLFYDGNIKMARLRGNVRMENRKTTLTTDSLNYDRMMNLAYYYTGGKIYDHVNTLTSIWGQYSTSNGETLFRDEVKLKNKDFTLDADSLRYNTKTHIANLVSPTHILYQDETDIFSNRGWYNTATDRCMLLNRSLIKHKDGRTIIGDTLFYDKKQKYGEGFKDVVMVDSVHKSTLYGDYSYYSDKDKIGMAADSALLIDWSSKDTMYVHADTLFTLKDSIYDVARGYHGVRFYRNDVQGLCDSLCYSARDSVLNMVGRPVVWAENNQLSGDSIKAYTRNQKINEIRILQSAIAIQHHDSVYYNQLSGKEIIAHLDSNQVRKVDVNGNAETIYYPVDDKDSTIFGMNKTQSSFVVMYMKDKKVERVVLTTASTGKMYPLLNLKESDIYLRNFFWLEEQRPKCKDDLFLDFSEKSGKGKSNANHQEPENSERPDEKSKRKK